MTPLSFDIVSHRVKSKYDLSLSQKLYYLAMIILAVFAAVIYLSMIYLELDLLALVWVRAVLIICSLMVLAAFVIRFFNYNGNNLIIDGKMTIDSSSIVIDDKLKFLIKDLKSLDFKLSDFKEKLIFKKFEVSGPARSYGAENYLYLMDGEKEIKIQFVIGSKYEYNLLVKELIPNLDPIKKEASQLKNQFC